MLFKTFTPRGHNASSTAPINTVLVAMQPSSPAPLVPILVAGDGVSKCVISISGATQTVGIPYSFKVLACGIPAAS